MICVAFRAWLLSRFAHIAARIGTSLLLSHNQTPRVLRLETRIRPGRGVKVTAGPRRRAFRLLELTVPPPGPVTRLPQLPRAPLPPAPRQDPLQRDAGEGGPSPQPVPLGPTRSAVAVVTLPLHGGESAVPLGSWGP